MARPGSSSPLHRRAPTRSSAGPLSETEPRRGQRRGGGARRRSGAAPTCASTRALLADIAQATGGAFFETPSFSLSDVPLAEPPLVEVGRSKDQPLWDRWYWLALMVAVVGLEWGVRRRFGYI